MILNILDTAFLRAFLMIVTFFQKCIFYYAAANMLISKFSFCSTNVKVSLFRVYCCNIYCCSLWSPERYLNNSINRLRVAFNGSVRKFFRLNYRDSIRQFLVSNDLPGFGAIVYRSTYSLFSRIATTKNSLLRTIFTMCHRVSTIWMNFVRLLLH